MRYVALAEPHRRRILDLLRGGERPVADLVDRLGHVASLYTLRPQPLAEVDEWLEPYRAYWSSTGSLVPFRPIWPIRNQGFVSPVAWTPDAGETFETLGQSGEILELEPPWLLAWAWGGELFRFELRPDGEGCLLVFTHVFDAPALGEKHEAGWEMYLERLDAHLGRAGRPAAGGTAPLMLEDGPILRLERRYDPPVERVWRAISEPGERAHWFPADMPLTVTESAPPHLLEAFWGEDALRFELRPEGDGCILVFTHAFAEPIRPPGPPPGGIVSECASKHSSPEPR